MHLTLNEVHFAMNICNKCKIHSLSNTLKWLKYTQKKSLLMDYTAYKLCVYLSIYTGVQKLKNNPFFCFLSLNLTFH